MFIKTRTIYLELFYENRFFNRLINPPFFVCFGHFLGFPLYLHDPHGQGHLYFVKNADRIEEWFFCKCSLRRHRQSGVTRSTFPHTLHTYAVYIWQFCYDVVSSLRWMFHIDEWTMSKSYWKFSKAWWWFDTFVVILDMKLTVH